MADSSAMTALSPFPHMQSALGTIFPTFDLPLFIQSVLPSSEEPPNTTLVRVFPSGSNNSFRAHTFATLPLPTPPFHLSLEMAPIRTHACTEAGCTKAFARAFDLKRHESTHNKTDRWEFKCPSCETTMLQKSGLITHYRATHTDLKPYKCSECRQATADPSSLRRHCKELGHAPVVRSMGEIRAENNALGNSIGITRVRVTRSMEDGANNCQSQGNYLQEGRQGVFDSTLAPRSQLQEGYQTDFDTDFAAISQLQGAFSNTNDRQGFRPGPFGDPAGTPYALYDQSTTQSLVNSQLSVPPRPPPPSPASVLAAAAARVVDDPSVDMVVEGTVNPQDLSLDPAIDPTLYHPVEMSRSSSGSSTSTDLVDLTPATPPDDIPGPSSQTDIDLTKYRPAFQSMYDPMWGPLSYWTDDPLQP